MTDEIAGGSHACPSRISSAQQSIPPSRKDGQSTGSVLVVKTLLGLYKLAHGHLKANGVDHTGRLQQENGPTLEGV